MKIRLIKSIEYISFIRFIYYLILQTFKILKINKVRNDEFFVKFHAKNNLSLFSTIFLYRLSSLANNYFVAPD